MTLCTGYKGKLPCPNRRKCDLFTAMMDKVIDNSYLSLPVEERMKDAPFELKGKDFKCKYFKQ